MNHEMTIEEAVALGRRMMACEGWAWRPGMRYINTEFGDQSSALVDYRGPLLTHWGLPPDPRDPGTLGHAETMMRKAVAPDAIGARVPHLVATLSVEHAESVTEWCVRSGMTFHPPATTRAEAIVNAWETAGAPS